MKKLSLLVLSAALAALFYGGEARAQSYPGVFACPASQWMNGTGAGGIATCAQPLPADIGLPWVSAQESFGVKCDGVSDDTVTIGNALAGANGLNLLFPPNAACLTDPQIINAGGLVFVGTFTSGSAVVTGLPTTTNMRAGQTVTGYSTVETGTATISSGNIVTFNSNSSTADLSTGMTVTGGGCPGGTTVLSIDSTAQFHTSAACSNGAATLTITNVSIPTTTIKTVDSATQVTLNANATGSGTQQITFSINNMPRAIYAYGTTFLARASSSRPTLTLDNIPGSFNSIAISGLKIDANNLHAQALKLHGVQFAYLRDLYLARGTAGGWWLSGEPKFGIYNNLFENIASFSHTGAGVIAKSINNPGPSPQSYIAANGFLNITSQGNTSFGLDVNWANLNLVSWRSEFNSDCGINSDNTQQLDLTGPWLEANKSPDCSIASTANTLNVKIHGGQMLGTITPALLTAPSTVIFSSNVIAPITNFGGLTFTNSGVTLPASYNLVFTGSGSGTGTIVAQAAAGTPTLTLPNTTGTFAVGASSPLALSATTGNLTCSTCATTTNGGLITGAAPIAVSAAGAISLNQGYGLSTASNNLVASLTTASNSLGADVTLNNTANYFDGPSAANGTSGTWFATGTVTVTDTAINFTGSCKLWDGTNAAVASTNIAAFGGANAIMTISLSGFFTSPAGNIRISCKDTAATTGKILFNASGNSKDSTVSAVRTAN